MGSLLGVSTWKERLFGFELIDTVISDSEKYETFRFSFEENRRSSDVNTKEVPESLTKERSHLRLHISHFEQGDPEGDAQDSH
jgi:hypothetical protein